MYGEIGKQGKRLIQIPLLDNIKYERCKLHVYMYDGQKNQKAFIKEEKETHSVQHLKNYIFGKR